MPTRGENRIEIKPIRHFFRVTREAEPEPDQREFEGQSAGKMQGDAPMLVIHLDCEPAECSLPDDQSNADD